MGLDILAASEVNQQVLDDVCNMWDVIRNQGQRPTSSNVLDVAIPFFRGLQNVKTKTYL